MPNSCRLSVIGCQFWGGFDALSTRWFEAFREVVARTFNRQLTTEQMWSIWQELKYQERE